uniref:Uncharacterized protein n=1 Tax=Oryza glumipatula TaxID=40148 RepID=A0A0D9YHR0_9ORYZ
MMIISPMRERDPWKQIKPWERTSYAVTRRAEHRRRPPRGPIPRREEGEGRCINSNVTTLPDIGGEKQKYRTEKKSERPREEEEREGEAQSANGALRPRLLASARPPAPAPFLSCPTRRITPLSFLHTYHAAEKESPTTERMIGGGD